MNTEGLADYLRRHPHPGGLIVCPEHRWLWMKPGKTAGSSIARAVIEPQCYTLQHARHTHEEFKEWLGAVTDSDLADYFIWATIRNPWARMISALAYFHIPPRDFLEDPPPFLYSNRSLLLHTMPLRFYANHDDGRRFADHLVHVESLTEDFDPIRERLGVDATPIPKLNTSNHGPYREYFDSKLRRETFARYFGKDAETFGYEF